jgi:hypothetical protein
VFRSRTDTPIHACIHFPVFGGPRGVSVREPLSLSQPLPAYSIFGPWPWNAPACNSIVPALPGPLQPRLRLPPATTSRSRTRAPTSRSAGAQHQHLHPTRHPAPRRHLSTSRALRLYQLISAGDQTRVCSQCTATPRCVTRPRGGSFTSTAAQ